MASSHYRKNCPGSNFSSRGFGRTATDSEALFYYTKWDTSPTIISRTLRNTGLEVTEEVTEEVTPSVTDSVTDSGEETNDPVAPTTPSINGSTEVPEEDQGEKQFETHEDKEKSETNGRTRTSPCLISVPLKSGLAIEIYQHRRD